MFWKSTSCLAASKTYSGLRRSRWTFIALTSAAWRKRWRKLAELGAAMKLEELDSQLENNQLSGFWRTRVPSHAAEAPYLWKWEPLLDGLLKASETIGIEQ